jgi:hypothetical protein
MEMNENFVAEEVTENVEQTTEQIAEQPKMFTQDEVNEIVSKGKARERAKITKQFERKYGQLEEVLRAGTGKDNVEDMTNTFRQFYEKKGIVLPQKPAYTDRDIEVLARAEAEDIIRAGFEDVVEETERLAEIGVENMTAREKAVFKTLAEHRYKTERSRELNKIGVTEDVYNSEDFRDFAGMFNPNTPIEKVYKLYTQNQPKKEIKTMGSMKNNASAESAVKEYYTPEEAAKFSVKELRDNPAIEKAILASMQKWK